MHVAANDVFLLNCQIVEKVHQAALSHMEREVGDLRSVCWSEMNLLEEISEDAMTQKDNRDNLDETLFKSQSHLGLMWRLWRCHHAFAQRVFFPTKVEGRQSVTMSVRSSQVRTTAPNLRATHGDVSTRQ